MALNRLYSFIIMITSDSLLYPSTSAISYAAWLNYFSKKIPEYAKRYSLTCDEVSSIQVAASEYTNWLIEQINYATQLISQRHKYTPLINSESPKLVISDKFFLLDQIALLVQHIRSHANYTIADGLILRLAEAPLLRGAQRRPGPRLHLIPSLCSKIAPLITWSQQRGTVLELQVNRDGCNWHTLLTTSGVLMEDTYSQPLCAIRWQYRARYCWPDWPVSEWSDIIIWHGSRLNLITGSAW